MATIVCNINKNNITIYGYFGVQLHVDYVAMIVYNQDKLINKQKPKKKVEGTKMKAMKTRKAYGEHSNGNIYYLGDTVEGALKANMMVRDYEKELVKLNPQLKITFKIEER